MTSDLAIAAARAALADAGLDRRRHRRADRRHRHPRPDLPLDRGQGAERHRHARRLRLRHPGGLRRLRLRARPGRRADPAPAPARRVMVIGAETFSRILDFTDRATCVLFGDGAGALILEAAEGTGDLGRPRHPRHRPAFRRPLRRPALRRRRPVHRPAPPAWCSMAGQEVFKHAVVKLAETGAAALARAGPRHRRHRLAGAAPGEPADHDA